MRCTLPVLLFALTACRAPGPAPLEILEELHETVRARFFDARLAGVDWDAALEHARAAFARTGTPAERAAATNAMLAELGASHTAYLTDEDPAWYVLLELFWHALDDERRARLFPHGPPLWPGIGILAESTEIDGQEAWFVRGVLAGGPAQAAGVLRGDRLLAVDDEPYQPVSPFRERIGEPTRLRLQRTRDPETTLELGLVPEALPPGEIFLRALERDAVVHARDGKRLAHARLWSYAGEELHAKLRELLLEGALADADGLVLDLRAGFGGANPDCLNLFRRDLPRLTYGARDGRELTLESSWTRPTVLLVDEGTTSGKEIFAHGFRRLGLGSIVGTRTAGAVLGGRAFLLADGSLLYLATADVRVDGQRLEGVGVTPDLLVPFARPYSAGADPQLERALDVLAAELEG